MRTTSATPWRISSIHWSLDSSASAQNFFIRTRPHDAFFFFFQAEDGIRDLTVTGVQTCALPIFEPEDLLPEVVVLPAADPEEGAGLGVSVIWRFDLRVEQPSVISQEARGLYESSYPDMSPAEIAAATTEVGPALQAITELAGLDA